MSFFKILKYQRINKIENFFGIQFEYTILKIKKNEYFSTVDLCVS